MAKRKQNSVPDIPYNKAAIRVIQKAYSSFLENAVSNLDNSAVLEVGSNYINAALAELGDLEQKN